MAIKQRTKSLQARGEQLSSTFFQLQVLNGKELTDMKSPSFVQQMQENTGFSILKPSKIEIFQLNIGKLCNQSCAHCHVDAGPDRVDENMSREHLEKCLAIIQNTPSITTVDITGGAPEMHPLFRWFVEECSKAGKKVIDRCNLTIIQANPKYHDLPQFLAKHKVNVVSSLPYFSKNRTDSQRGDGVFEDSIKSLQQLNAVGYGMPGSDLQLDLVYNPTGSFLPSGQAELEREFKQQLLRKFDIEFNSLFCITNMPISRYLEYLLQAGIYEEYMQKLLDAYNPSTIMGLMCRNTISVSWDGFLYDCDFNQMLDLQVSGNHQHIDDFDLEALNHRDIVLNQHCYGCTAGSGSSCGGEVA
jgi:radical SAM/Cys-rich protein